MYKYVLSAIAAVALFFVAGSTARAHTAVFGFNDNNGSPNSGTYSPGDSFTFSITLTFAPGGTVQNLEGLSYFFTQVSPSGAPFYFAITNRDVTGSMFTDLQTPHIVYPQNLTPQNPSDLGALLPAADNAVGAGTYFIANLTFSISPSAAPGVYTIGNAAGGQSAVTDDLGHTAPIPQALYTITIVPEPGTLALCATGLPIALGFLRRRRR